MLQTSSSKPVFLCKFKTLLQSQSITSSPSHCQSTTHVGFDVEIATIRHPIGPQQRIKRCSVCSDHLNSGLRLLHRTFNFLVRPFHLAVDRTKANVVRRLQRQYDIRRLIFHFIQACSCSLATNHEGRSMPPQGAWRWLLLVLLVCLILAGELITLQR